MAFRSSVPAELQRFLSILSIFLLGIWIAATRVPCPLRPLRKQIKVTCGVHHVPSVPKNGALFLCSMTAGPLRDRPRLLPRRFLGPSRSPNRLVAPKKCRPTFVPPNCSPPFPIFDFFPYAPAKAAPIVDRVLRPVILGPPPAVPAGPGPPRFFSQLGLGCLFVKWWPPPGGLRIVKWPGQAPWANRSLYQISVFFILRLGTCNENKPAPGPKIFPIGPPPPGGSPRL